MTLGSRGTGLPGRSIKPVGCQPRPRLGDHGRNCALAYGCHLLGFEEQLAPVVAPHERPDDDDTLAGHGPAPARVAGRARDRHLSGTVTQHEVRPTAPRSLRAVHLALYGHPADGGHRTGDLAREPDQAQTPGFRPGRGLALAPLWRRGGNLVRPERQSHRVAP